MSDISSFVDVQITAGTVTPSRAAFGVPLLLTVEAYAVIGSGQSLEVSSPREVTDAGFTANSATYALAEAFFRQKPRPPKLIIGAYTTNITQVVELEFSSAPADGDVYTIEIMGADGTVEEHTYTATGGDTGADVADAIRTSIGTSALAITADAGPGSPVIVTADNANEMFRYRVLSTPGIFHFGFLDETVASAGVTASLDALQDVLAGSFYGVVLDLTGEDAQDAAAAWVLTNKKLFGGMSGNASAATAKALSNDRAYFLSSTGEANQAPASPINSYEFAPASWMGDMFARDAGTAAWAYKTLEGVPALKLATSAKSFHETSGGNWYGLIGGVGITYPGKVASGEWIDITRGVDRMTARMEERIYAAKLNNPKIPYTDPGINILKSEVEAQLKEEEDRGFLAPGWTVTAVSAEDSPAADRANRDYTGLEFSARLAGAIITSEVRGTVTA